MWKHSEVMWYFFHTYFLHSTFYFLLLYMNKFPSKKILELQTSNIVLLHRTHTTIKAHARASCSRDLSRASCMRILQQAFSQYYWDEGSGSWLWGPSLTGKVSTLRYGRARRVLIYHVKGLKA